VYVRDVQLSAIIKKPISIICAIGLDLFPELSLALFLKLITMVLITDPMLLILSIW
jgi:hypothetical protein